MKHEEGNCSKPWLMKHEEENCTQIMVDLKQHLEMVSELTELRERVKELPDNETFFYNILKERGKND
jgi:hypothetical protein|tara:strand:+ start:930 stop:1130 length:201 start_codon:yes stop_codon:yes gene_type:complete